MFVCGHITPISASCLTDSSSVCVSFCLSFIITSLIITFKAQPQNQEYLLISKSLTIISAKGSFPNEVAFTSSVLRTGISLLESHHSFSPLQLLIAKRGKSEASLTEVNTTLPKNKTINMNAVKHQLTGHTRNRTLQGWMNKIQTMGNYRTKTQFLQQVNCKWGGWGRWRKKRICDFGGRGAAPCAMWDLSSLIRDRTCSLCSGSMLNHCTAREVPRNLYMKRNLSNIIHMHCRNLIVILMWKTLRNMNKN